MRWRPVDLPDFRHYVVERAEAPDGPWRAVAESAAATTGRTVDAAPAHGTWRYRVLVGRAGEDGATRTSTSDAVTVTVAAAGRAGRRRAVL